MNTQVLPVSEESIKLAATLITQGEIVAFPTETVYGLGADALNPIAVEKIFIAKNRPADNPLIVHISDLSQLSLITSGIPAHASTLIKTFWPGPISLVLPKHPNLPQITTAGHNTVVVRFPAHPVAQALIQAANTPIAAPSANTSGRVSPTKAQHVLDDLNGKIPLILDDGHIEYGLESTVVDCTSNIPTVLRPGSITLEMLKEIIPQTYDAKETDSTRSPGMKYRHYAPEAPIMLFVGEPVITSKAIQDYLMDIETNTVSIIWHTGDFDVQPKNFKLPTRAREAAPLLFETLRKADAPSVARIIVQGYSTNDVGAAIMNRLQKAAHEIIKV